MKIDMRGGSPRQDGFGVAGRSIYNTLESLGHEINPDSELTFVFTHPHNFVTEGEFNIGYFPWESTEPLDGWRRKMRKMDEIWVTSPVMCEYVKEWGFDPYVFQHGVNDKWIPQLRTADEGKIRFLHQGLEAYRKGGKEAMSAFSAAFQGRNDVELIMKTSVQSMNFQFGKVSTNAEIIPASELRELYYSAHVMVCPSYGEGFGIPAFDAMGTGMPTIMTSGVFPHEEFTTQDLIINSTVIDSQWPDVHPGKMFQPDFDDLVEKMRNVADNYDYYAMGAHLGAKVIHEEATWEVRTKKAFDDLALRIKQ